MPLSERFPGYEKMDNGALQCKNKDELDCQSGIFYDIIKRAGKTLMEGKGIVGISLPVKIFEKRSMVEKMCDLWCTGPTYLNKAALTGDFLERMRLVVTFVVSGLH